MIALDIILVVIAVVLIILCLLQGGKSDGASSAIMGGMGNKSFADLKERGAEKTLSTITICLAAAFFVIAVLIRIFAKM